MHDTAVLGGGGMAEQSSAVLGGGGIAVHDTAVLGGGGMAERSSAVLGGGGITEHDTAFASNSILPMLRRPGPGVQTRFETVARRIPHPAQPSAGRASAGQSISRPEHQPTKMQNGWPDGSA